MTELEGRKLDIAMAKFMGWEIHFAPLEFKGTHNWLLDRAHYPYIYVPVIDDEKLYLFMEPKQSSVEFAPSRDIAAAWLVEERIEELGLVGNYCKYLNYMADAKWEAGDHSGRSWQIIHATPEERCRAALMATEAE